MKKLFFDSPIAAIIFCFIGGIVFFSSGIVNDYTGYNTGNIIGGIIFLIGFLVSLFHIIKRIRW